MLRRMVLHYIKKADNKVIDEILYTAMRRKETLFPCWEICYLALPKNDSEKRRKTIEKMLELENSAADVQKSIPSISKY